MIGQTVYHGEGRLPALAAPVQDMGVDHSNPVTAVPQQPLHPKGQEDPAVVKGQSLL